ncbi:MAG TPA: chlorite dismutase family protein [Thermomicrobiales bacterium]|nr:chlorite dismutase family protein [Thermomicrobiales bacterium]
MAESTGQTTYANFWIYHVDPLWRRLTADQKESGRCELASVLGRASDEGVTLRGAYSTVGLRHDAEMILWVVTRDLDAMQRLAVAISQSCLGAYLESRYTYLGVALGSRYTADHAPAFIKGVPPKRYLSVYPFIKSHEWYQLPFEERRTIMGEHGRLGREYPNILTNTVSSFGIADHEFVVAFEADDIGEMVRMVEHLRPAGSRPYTKLDTPIFLGVMKDLADVLADLG